VGGPLSDVSREVVFANRLAQPIRWRAETTAPWLSLSADQGVLASGRREHVAVSIDRRVAERLPAGEYFAELSFRNAQNPRDHVAVELVLTLHDPAGAATMLVTPEDGYFARGNIGEQVEPKRKGYRVANIGGLALDYDVSITADWVRVDGATAGQLPPGESQAINLFIDQDRVSMLGSGDHFAMAEFRNLTNGRGGCRRRIEVELVPDGRVIQGLQALYSFDAGTGGVVQDQSGVGAPMDLLIADTNACHWLPGALSIVSPTRIATRGPASKLIDACRATNEITVEAWIRPSDLQQDGPARIVTLSEGPYERNFTLGQGLWGSQPKDVFDVRLRTSSTDLNGKPSTTTPQGSARADLVHLAFTRNQRGDVRIFVDGRVVETGRAAGDFSNWSPTSAFLLGNEAGADRSWLGAFHLLAVYDRSLSESEIEHNFNQGTQDPGVGFLSISPGGNFNASGIEGGPFTPANKIYRLENTGEAPLLWSASTATAWVRVDGPASGSLEAGELAQVRLELVPSAIDAFTPGTYQAVASFVNLSSGLGTATRRVNLTVNPEGGGESGDKPGPHNTGPTHPDLLVPIPGTTITVDGLTLENVDIRGPVNVAANNVTFRNFKANANGSAYAFRMDYGKTGIVFEDGEVVGASAAAFYGSDFTLRRLDIHDVGNDAVKSSRNVTMEYCWIHHLGTTPDSHADGNQTRGGGNIILRYNNFDMPKGIPGHNTNACCITTTPVGPVDNFLMEGNWLNGGNYTLYFEDKGHGAPTNVRLINNRFGRDYRHGVLVNDGPVFAQGNVWDDTDEPMDINNH
jgi:hypothetical protein